LDSITTALTGFLEHNNNPLGLLLLGLSALIEYVFPPFPGDTVVLFGAFLVTRHGWSLPLVFLVVMAGSGVGAMADFAFGVWLGRSQGGGLRGFLLGPVERQRKIEGLLDAFRRHGEAYIAINRFLPAVRALFFVAAGMARLRAGRVLFFSLASAAAWNTLIIGAGFAVGKSWEGIERFFRLYTTLAWAALGAVAVVLLVRFLLRRGRRAPSDGGSDGGPGGPPA
jgi:membrane protein DedA with SNARE-associated domain